MMRIGRKRRQRPSDWEELAGRIREHERGVMQISYILPNCSIGGGPKVVLQHCQYLWDKGHDVRLFTVNSDPGWWFQCRFPVTVCESYEDAMQRMAQIEGIKVATWWETAHWVQLACRERGTPVHLVQEIETSYYPNNPEMWPEILGTYQMPWKLMLTDSEWTQEQLRGMQVKSPIYWLPCPVDLDTFHPREDVVRDPNRLLYIGRAQPLKGFLLMHKALEILATLPAEWGMNGFHVVQFGTEPNMELPFMTAYHNRVSEEQAARLYNGAFCYVLSSDHEGFGVPILEAMASGCPVITTLADGNDHFCEDGENCLTVGNDPVDLAAAIYRLWKRPGLQLRLAEAGLETAKCHQLPFIGDRLESEYRRIAQGGGREDGTL